MVYGVAIEAQQADGSFRPYAGTLRDPDNAIPHRFDAICVPEGATFVRNEVGLMASNPCRAGDRTLPVAFNVRVGHTKFTMDVK